MPSDLFLATVIRWVALSALAVVIGGLAIELVVLPLSAPEAAAARRLRRIGVVALAVLTLASVGELAARTFAMAGGGSNAALRAIPAVLGGTHFGTIWIARLVALTLALALGASSSRFARLAVLLLVLGTAFSTSATGHAGDWGDASPTALVDWLHVVAGGAWIGGLACLTLALRRELLAWPSELLGRVAFRFSRLAGACLVVVVLSGAYNTWVQLARPSALWSTAYGRGLSVKLVTVLGIVSLGAINRYAVLPRLAVQPRRGGVRLFRRVRLALLGPQRPGQAAARARFSRYVTREACLGLVVFALTAFLGQSVPGRHAGHRLHVPGVEEGHGPFRVTMEELHRSGGVPEGWRFRPPAGDAAHGRQLFVELGCAGCHVVRGEGFPASSGAGPELTGVGEHHPADYLTESIINPDAVVVEGPGYTRSDGRSIMPDYGKTLTVAQLADLVAYLESLRVPP